MAWTVSITDKAEKRIKGMPSIIKGRLILINSRNRSPWTGKRELAELRQALQHAAPLPLEEGKTDLCGRLGSRQQRDKAN